MRKAKVISLVLSLVLMMSLVACGGGGVKTGTYKLTGMTVGGVDMSAFIALAESMGQSSGELQIIDDKNAKLVMSGESDQALTYDDKYFYGGGQKIEYKASGSKITMSYTDDDGKTEMVFEKK